jgi:tetratricopeptide (TPR) repeat protein
VGRLAAVEPKDRLARAEGAFRAALDADPGLVEARVRRGRTLLLLGRRAEAGAELERSLGEARDVFVRYLALLFKGRWREGEGDLQGAAEAYRAAGALAPDAQAAYVGLGHVLDLLGDTAGAQAALARAVERGGRLDRIQDPWWIYPYGEGQRLEALLAALAAEARR